MKFEAKTVRRTINKAYLKELIEREAFTQFKASFRGLIDGAQQAEQADEREEYFKNLLAPFFKELGFVDYNINTSSNIDLAIYTGSKTKAPLGVLMEVKRPSNKSEIEQLVYELYGLGEKGVEVVESVINEKVKR